MAHLGGEEEFDVIASWGGYFIPETMAVPPGAIRGRRNMGKSEFDEHHVFPIRYQPDRMPELLAFYVDYFTGLGWNTLKTESANAMALAFLVSRQPKELSGFLTISQSDNRQDMYLIHFAVHVMDFSGFVK